MTKHTTIKKLALISAQAAALTSLLTASGCSTSMHQDRSASSQKQIVGGTMTSTRMHGLTDCKQPTCGLC